MVDLLEGKTAVVTGAASGMGRATSFTFAEHGADVVVSDVREEPREGGRPTHEKITDETNSSATFVSCDVSSPDDLDAAVAAAEEFGGIDIMVNNAGIGGQFELADDYEFKGSNIEKYDRTMDVNARGVYLGSYAAYEHMKENGGGTIVNIASINADFGRGTHPESGADTVPYCTSKGAVKTMTYSLADAFGPEVRVNAIHPGSIETAMSSTKGTDLEEERIASIPSGRVGKPQDIANAVLLLVSDYAEYINAESLVVDGGWTHTI